MVFVIVVYTMIMDYECFAIDLLNTIVVSYSSDDRKDIKKIARFYHLNSLQLHCVLCFPSRVLL